MPIPVESATIFADVEPAEMQPEVPRSVSCPACGASDVCDRGPLPSLAQSGFGGCKVSVRLEAGNLFSCPDCDLRFRYPYLDQSALTRLYEELPDTVWAESEPKPAWRRLVPLLEHYAANDKVLDVGCFRGDFLAWLPGQWHKFGVEPNSAAGAIAARRLELFAPTLEHLPPDVGRLGAVTVLDVLEHLREPMPTLARLRRLLAPGGCLIVLTGAADSFAWRLMGRHYWYSALPEHVTYYSLRWFRWAADRLGLRLARHVRLSSQPAGWRDWFVQGAKQSLFAGMRIFQEVGVPRTLLAGLPLVGRAAHWQFPPWWPAAKDHLIVVLSDR